MSTVLAWVATYLLHSTILILGAWLLERRWRDRPERMSAVWKVALFGGVATASLQMLLSISPIAGVWNVSQAVSVPSDPVLAAGVAVDAAPVREPVLASQTVIRRQSVSARTVVLRVNHSEDPTEAVVTPAPAASVSPIGPGATSLLHQMAPWLVGGITLGAMIGLFSVIGALAVLRQRLAGRQRLRDGSLVAQLDRLRRSAGLRRPVELAVANKVRTPMAVGIWRAQIVLPPEAAEALSSEQQEGLLAHELAHVVRHDPLWRIVGLLFERVLFFQPLNRLASARISTYAEYLCDDWAAKHTQAPLDLARCLTEVARWVAQPSVVAATMVGPRSILGSRVQRLIRPSTDAKRPAWLAAPLAGLLLTMLLVAPSVSAQRVDAEEESGQGEDTNASLAANVAPSERPSVVAAPDKKRRRAKRSSKRRAKAKPQREPKTKAKAKARSKNRKTSHKKPKVYRVREDGSVEAIEGAEAVELEREVAEVLEDLENIKGVERRIEGELSGHVEVLEALGELQELQELHVLIAESDELIAASDAEMAEGIRALQALGEVVDHRHFESLGELKGLAMGVEPALRVIEALELEGAQITIEVNGEEITVEVIDERNKRQKARSRKNRRKHDRKRRRGARKR